MQTLDYFFEQWMQIGDAVVLCAAFRPIAGAPQSRSGKTCWLISLCTVGRV